MALPTVGRMVYVYTAGAKESGAQPRAAIVAYVHNSGHINLSLIDTQGFPYGETQVPFIEEGMKPPSSGLYAEWMPYQLQQQKKDDPYDNMKNTVG